LLFLPGNDVGLPDNFSLRKSIDIGMHKGGVLVGT